MLSVESTVENVKCEARSGECEVWTGECDM